MRDLPGPGIEPVFPALAGGFLTTSPQGSPGLLVLKPGQSQANQGSWSLYLPLYPSIKIKIIITVKVTAAENH